MEEKANHESSSGDGNNGKGELSAVIDDRFVRVPNLRFYSLPKNLRRIIGDYISDDQKNLSKCAVLDEQRITLRLSQHARLELGSFWHFGCLSPEDQWETSMEVREEKKFLIKDHQSCLDFFSHENSPFYDIAIEVLVLRLDLSSQDFSNTLDDLQYTLVRLEEHMKSVQHVVLALEKYVFCCFSFKDVIEHATGRRQTIDRLRALIQILSDLRTCSTTNQTLSTKLLLDHYILSDVKPGSDVYLSKFIILLNHLHNKDLFDAIDPALKFSKVRWLYSLETVDEVEKFDQRIFRRCHAIHLDASKFRDKPFLLHHLGQAFSLEENPFIERVVINHRSQAGAMNLHRLNAPLTDNTPRSALIELILKGTHITFDLTQLNNGYFSNLTHLSIIGGELSGRLDSQSVPNLKTLRIELGNSWDRTYLELDERIREHTQRLIETGLPWQIVATDSPGGWSLASYDEPTANPQKEEKENSPRHSLPLIRELMIVMCSQFNADECQSRFNGHPPLEPAAEDQNNVEWLAWAPDRVEKIAAYCSSKEQPQLEFKEEIPGQTSILTSITSLGVGLLLDGAALPHLEILELDHCKIWLSGTFTQLQTLSFQYAVMQSLWELDAPLLQSLNCQPLRDGNKLSLRLQLLPYLSFLSIKEPRYGNPKHCPTILVDENSLGLSRITHVVFGNEMIEAPFFDQCQVHRVAHLELTVDALKPPASWRNTDWQCETLKIEVYSLEFDNENPPDAPVTVVLPPLPRVKKLTVTEMDCYVLLDSEMPELINLRVPTPKSLGSNLKCPALKCIYFTEKLSETDKERCLDPTTYEAIGAQPRWVYFTDGEELKRMSWDAAPNATGHSSFKGPLGEEEYSSVPRE